MKSKEKMELLYIIHFTFYIFLYLCAVIKNNYGIKSRNRWIAECGQVNSFQLSVKRKGAGGKFPILYD